jgi:hypothetical protein
MPERVRKVESYEELPKVPEMPTPVGISSPPATIPPVSAPEPATTPTPTEASVEAKPAVGMATLILKVGDKIVLEIKNVTDFIGAVEVEDQGMRVIPSTSLSYWAWALKFLDFELTTRIASIKMAAAQKQANRGIVLANELPKSPIQKG